MEEDPESRLLALCVVGLLQTVVSCLFLFAADASGTAVSAIAGTAVAYAWLGFHAFRRSQRWRLAAKLGVKRGDQPYWPTFYRQHLDEFRKHTEGDKIARCGCELGLYFGYANGFVHVACRGCNRPYFRIVVADDPLRN